MKIHVFSQNCNFALNRDIEGAKVSEGPVLHPNTDCE